MSKVIIVGAGMAGLAAAHELVERGYQVEIYERNEICGGKARSIMVPNVGSGTPLPGEDGFRFFPGFYKHVPHTMLRIPFPGGPTGTVFDNLVDAKQIAILQEGQPPYIFPSAVPTSVAEWKTALIALYSSPVLNLTMSDAEFFVSRILCLLSSCDQRRLEQYEQITWWDFIDAKNRSLQYQKICAMGLTRSLVAMQPTLASTRSVGTILIQILMDIVSVNGHADRVLNGPTNDVWIDPWVNHLKSKGVQLFLQWRATGLTYDAATNRVTSLQGMESGNPTTVTGDHYILAVPVEVSAKLIGTDIMHAAPSLANLNFLATACTSWMVGIQFYLKRLLTSPIGHAIYADSPWAVTSIAQGQFWTAAMRAKYLTGQVQDVLSCDISDWFTKGDQVFTSSANQATIEDQIKDEVWAEVKAHWVGSASGQLTDNDLVTFFLSPQIKFQPTATDVEPLFINRVNSRQFRPKPTTKILNLFVASDYVITNTDLATMEAANEAGRRAANGILDVEGSTVNRAAVFPLIEPPEFAPLKQSDEILYSLDKSTPALLCLLSPPSTGGPLTPTIPLSILGWIIVALLAVIVMLETLNLLW